MHAAGNYTGTREGGGGGGGEGGGGGIQAGGDDTPLTKLWGVGDGKGNRLNPSPPGLGKRFS